MAIKKPLCLYNDKIKQIQEGDQIDADTAGGSTVKADSADPISGYLSDKADGTTIEVDSGTHKLKVKSGVYELVGVAAGLMVTHLSDFTHADIAHANRAVLDATSASFTTTLKSTYDGYASSISSLASGKQDALGYTPVPDTLTVNGHALNANVTVSKSDVGLGNVPNTDCTNASNIASGTLDGDRLPAMSESKKGAVPATGTPSGKFLKDDGTFDSPAGSGDMLKADYDTAGTATVRASRAIKSGTTELAIGTITDAHILVRSGTDIVGVAIGNSADNIVKRSGSNAIAADTVSEITSATGVTVDGVLLKDGAVSGVTLSVPEANKLKAESGTSSVTVSGGAVSLVGGGISRYFVPLTVDRTNSTVTLADCEGLSATLEANKTYLFTFRVRYTTVIYTTGILLSVNGPTFVAGSLSINTLLPLANTSNMAPSHLGAWNAGVVSTQTGTGTGDNGRVFYTEISGTLTTGSDVTQPLILRFRSEVAGSAVTIKAGSLLELVKVD